MSSVISFIEELKRRNVLKLLTAYAVAGFIILQLCDILFPALGISDDTIAYVLIALAIGLPVIAIFGWMFELTPQGLKRTREVDNTNSITQTTGQRINVVIIALLSVAVTFFAYEYFTAPDQIVAPEFALAPAEQVPEASIISTPLVDGRPSIAVLPFVNMSSDTENEYFSDGLSEEVLNLLAQTRGLRVAGRTSSFFYKGKNENLTSIGEALKVGHLLEGSVRKSGNTVRITAQLISAIDGFHLWSQTYDRELSDIFAVQDEIAGEVTRALQVTLLTDGINVADRSTTNPETYDLYLRAKNALYARNLDSIRLSIQLFQEAIALDPEYAPAQIDYAAAELILTNNFNINRMEDALLRAKPALDKAAALGHLNDDYYATLGLYYSHARILGQSNYQQANTALARALELNPNNVRAHLWLSTNITARGPEPDRYTKGLALIEQALALDPLNRVANSNYANLLDAVGRTAEAEQALKHLIKTDPAYINYRGNLTMLYLFNFKLVETAESLVQLDSLSPVRGFILQRLLHTFNDERRFLTYSDIVPLESPEYEMVRAQELATISTTPELVAEAELYLMRPNPDLTTLPLIIELSRRQQYATVIRLAENYRPDYQTDALATTRSEFPLLDLIYISAIFQEGQVDRARRFASRQLVVNKADRYLGAYGKGAINVIMHLILEQREAAIEEFVSAVNAGWLDYHSFNMSNHPLIDEIRDDRRFQAAKARIDARLAALRPDVYKVLIDAGMIE